MTPKWLVIGEQGGGVVRGQVARTLGASSRLTAESFKSQPTGEFLFFLKSAFIFYFCRCFMHFFICVFLLHSLLIIYLFNFLTLYFSVDELYPPVRRSEDAFSHENHVGSVTATHCSPFSRNLFLSSGDDGCIKLFHMFEKMPLRRWDPEPVPGTIGKIHLSKEFLETLYFVFFFIDLLSTFQEFRGDRFCAIFSFFENLFPFILVSNISLKRCVSLS